MRRRCDIMFISSAGGHLTQLLRLQGLYDRKETVLVTERVPSTAQLRDELDSTVLFLPHGGREAPLSYVWKFAWNVLVSLSRIIQYRPAIVISTGAHTAIPTCIIAKLLGAKLIYIETFAKIRSPSLTGRILYPFADCFYVQWPELQRFYRKARYAGKLY
ncbi:PssD/Cps14F family polysaccharide biosynthesis glycosyltransferase [Rhodocyclaceae bacterium SMB388]